MNADLLLRICVYLRSSAVSILRKSKNYAIALKKKDNSLYQRVIHKIIEISKNPELGKPLRNVLKGKRRVHVGSSVLVYMIDKKKRNCNSP